uniref:Quinone oxidoreductase-like protein 1 n=1 Tax=Sphenodon punctatus TaxID=8508 RepID=A0A8D0H5Y5_SPHPU
MSFTSQWSLLPFLQYKKEAKIIPHTVLKVIKVSLFFKKKIQIPPPPPPNRLKKSLHFKSLQTYYSVFYFPFETVHKPEKVTWAEAAGTIRDGVRAYTALHYLSHVSPGKTVLIMDGASPFGTIAIQLAHHRGAKVISTAYTLEDKQYFERLTPVVARVIDVSNGKIDIAESCLEETGGLGVDIVLDAGVRLYKKENESTLKQQLLPHKHDILTLLSVGGHWVTTEENLQLDPPDIHCLFLKGATVSFLNDEVWNLSNVQQGKYLYILLMVVLEDVMEKLSSKIFRPYLDEPIPLYEAKVSMEIVQKNQARKRQVIHF